MDFHNSFKTQFPGLLSVAGHWISGTSEIAFNM